MLERHFVIQRDSRNFAILNVILDLICVLVLDWGVKGAAVATVFSQYVSGVGIGLYTLKKFPQLCPKRTDCRWDRKNLANILNLSVMTSVQQSIMNFGILMVQGLVNSFGTVIMAAFAAAVKIDSFAYMPVQDFGNAFSTYVAQNYGAGQIRRCRKTLYLCLIEDAVSLGATVALVLLTGRFLLSIFNNDPQVIALGYDRLKIVFFAYIFSLLYEVMSGYLRGFGISLVPAALTALGVCGIRIAWIHFAFPQHPTLQTIMTSYPVSLSATALMIFIALLCYRPARKHAAMEREPAPAGN